MKEKISAALTARYKNLGFGAKAISGVAHYLAKKVIYEEDIDGAIQDVKGLLEVFQSDVDTRVQRAVVKAKTRVQKKGGYTARNGRPYSKSMHTSKQKSVDRQSGEASKKRIRESRPSVDRHWADRNQALIEALAKKCIDDLAPQNEVLDKRHHITVICVPGEHYTISIQQDGLKSCIQHCWRLLVKKIWLR